MLKALNQCSLAEVNASIASSPLVKPFLITFSSPNAEIDESRLLSFFEASSVPSQPFFPMTASFSGEPQSPPGKIVCVQENAGITEWTLSNGLKVSVKQTELERDRLLISAWAKGGLGAFPRDLFTSAAASTQYAQPMHSVFALNQLLRSKAVEAHCHMTVSERSFDSSGSKAHLEFQLQLLHIMFSAPVFNPMYWDRLVSLYKESHRTMNNDPDRLFSQWVEDIHLQEHYFSKPIDPTLLQEHQAQQAFIKAFGSPQEFSFAVVGDFDPTELARLVEKYIASLPVLKKPSLQLSPLPALFPSQSIDRSYKAGEKTHSTVVMTIPYHPQKIWDRWHSFAIQTAVSKLLEQRLDELLRKQLGKTYTLHVAADSRFYPDLTNGELQITWTCQPEHCDEMIAIVRQELDRMKKMPPTQEETTTLQTLLQELRKDALLSNGYWLGRIHQAKLFGISIGERLAADAIIFHFTPELLHETAQMLLESPHSSTLIHYAATSASCCSPDAA